MYFGVARLELMVAQSRSLKEKRAVLHRIRDRLESRFRISVSEVDYQDLWQRAALGVALVAHSEESARNALQAVRREIESDPRLCVTEFACRVESFQAEDGDRWGDWDGDVRYGDAGTKEDGDDDREVGPGGDEQDRRPPGTAGGRS
jgi:uncharacterized protein